MDINRNESKNKRCEEVLIELGKRDSAEGDNPLTDPNIEPIRRSRRSDGDEMGENEIPIVHDNWDAENVIQTGNYITDKSGDFNNPPPATGSTNSQFPIITNFPLQTTQLQSPITRKAGRPTGQKSIHIAKEYKKLKFKEVIYQIGENLLIKESETSNMIGKLTKIKEKGGDTKHPDWPMIQVKWYYTKKDIEREKNVPSDQYFDSIGENELFDTDHMDYVFVDTINGKCNIMTVEVYDGATGLTASDYFSRASYNIKTSKLEPSIDKWSRMCSCEMPINPEQIYISCDECEQWFHPQCEGISSNPKTVASLTAFYCAQCHQRRIQKSTYPNDN